MTAFDLYRRKNPQVEAIQLTNSNPHEIEQWAVANDFVIVWEKRWVDGSQVAIVLQEGLDPYWAMVGDWIVRENGMVWVCGDAIFHEKFEIVS